MGAVPEAATVKVTVPPAVVDALAGWVVMLGAVVLGAGVGSGVGAVVVEVLPSPDDPPPPQAVTVIATSKRQASLVEEPLFIVVAALKASRVNWLYALEPDRFRSENRRTTVDFCSR